jgi:hypothetical protein
VLKDIPVEHAVVIKGDVGREAPAGTVLVWTVREKVIAHSGKKVVLVPLAASKQIV